MNKATLVLSENEAELQPNCVALQQVNILISLSFLLPLIGAPID
jgi:hypothetical protein